MEVIKIIDKWIPRNLVEGSLSHQLGIPVRQNIPMSLLQSIIKARAGQTIKNPTQIGFPTIKVTHKMEHRAILAMNLKNIKR